MIKSNIFHTINDEINTKAPTITIPFNLCKHSNSGLKIPTANVPKFLQLSEQTELPTGSSILTYQRMEQQNTTQSTTTKPRITTFAT